MIIAVDFDGTIIEAGHFPNLGPALPYAFEVLKKLQEKGHQLILWTCRGGKYLDAAVEFCKENGLTFDAINENIDKEYYNHTSNKIVANIYIDDAAYPVIKKELAGIPAIDWEELASDFGVDI
jgi:hydroxymethylpyrimidine pyrophosphatase-like HAD family hydrolase